MHMDMDMDRHQEVWAPWAGRDRVMAMIKGVIAVDIGRGKFMMVNDGVGCLTG